MKVLHITNAYPTESYSSFGIFIKEQIDSLEKIGVENKILFINAFQKGKLEYIRYVQKINDFNDIDIIHCHHQFSGLIPIIARIEKPKVLSILGDISKRSLIDKIIFKLVENKFNRIIYKNCFKSSDKRYIYLPNGVDTKLFKSFSKKKARARLGLDITKKYILFVSANGINNPIKRYDIYKEVLSQLKLYDSSIEELVLSNVKRGLVPYYYNAADILVLTSDHEGSPNAIKEAVACDLPIISRDVGDVSNLIGDIDGSYIINSAEISSFVNAAKNIFELKEYHSRQVIYEKGLTLESIAEKLKEIYSDTLKNSVIENSL